SPGATVTAVPPSQLQLADDLRTTDPAASPLPERAGLFKATALPLPVAEGVAEVGGLGCGPCAACGCGVDARASEWLSEANGFSLNRDVSALQAATLAAVSASTAARGNARERNISPTPHIAHTRTRHAYRVNTLRVNTPLRACAPMAPPHKQNRHNSRAFPGQSGTKRTPIRTSCLIPCSPFVSLTSCCGPACGPSGNTITPPSASSPTSASGMVSAAAVTMMRS